MYNSHETSNSRRPVRAFWAWLRGLPPLLLLFLLSVAASAHTAVSSEKRPTLDDERHSQHQSFERDHCTRARAFSNGVRNLRRSQIQFPLIRATGNHQEPMVRLAPFERYVEPPDTLIRIRAFN